MDETNKLYDSLSVLSDRELLVRIFGLLEAFGERIDQVGSMVGELAEQVEEIHTEVTGYVDDDQGFV